MNEHEQVNERSVALTGKATKGAVVISVKGAKITAKLLAMAMKASFNKVRGPRRSVKSLCKDGSSLENVEISGDNIGAFKKVAHKYKIKFALQCDKSEKPPKWLVLFKAKDSATLEAAFKEFSKSVLKQKSKPSMLADLAKFKELSATVAAAPVKNRVRGGHEH